MPKLNKQRVYYACVRLSLKNGGQDVGEAMPGDVVDIAKIGLDKDPGLLQYHLDRGLLRVEEFDLEPEPQPSVKQSKPPTKGEPEDES